MVLTFKRAVDTVFLVGYLAHLTSVHMNLDEDKIDRKFVAFIDNYNFVVQTFSFGFILMLK
jgi:hypothetical protein